MSSSISIIIPCLNEERYLQHCLDSILKSDIDLTQSEIILVDGGSEDKTVEIIQAYQEQYDAIKLLHNPKKFTPISMNMGIEASVGEYIFIISAHAKYENGYFSKLLKEIQRLNANCVGGILKTDVRKHTKKSNAIIKVLSHKFGVGNADFRIGGDEIKAVDTVAFGCYTKATFEEFGLYDKKLIRNQDIELNKRIINGGGKIYLIPDVYATYYARENFMDLAKNNFANGKWNILTAYYTKTLSSLSLRHFIPLFFVLSLLLPLPLALININFLWIAFLSLSSYLALVIILSLKLRDKETPFIYLVASFLTLHLAYGLGSLVGIFWVVKRIIKGKK